MSEIDNPYELPAATSVIVATRHSDGSATLRYTGPVTDLVVTLVEAFGGGFIVEQVLSAEDLAAHALLPNGVIVAHQDIGL